jgi:hypothetical protein
MYFINKTTPTPPYKGGETLPLYKGSPDCYREGGIMRQLILKITIFIIFSFLAINVSPLSVSANNNKPFVSSQQWKENTKGYNFDENFKTIKPQKQTLKKNNFSFDSMFSKLSNAKYIFVGIVILILVILIVFVLLGLFKDTRWRISKKEAIIDETNIENIENADLENMLKQALNKGLYKDAIRFQYLILIRTLNKRNFINWKKDKTNGHYISEMYGKNGFDLFRSITIKFERIWYGEADIKETDYLRLIPLFEQINLIVAGRD